MYKKKPFLIVFEGVEGCGKSFQSKKLFKKLKKKRVDVILTREPGGTKIAESLRNLILKVKSDINIQEEILLLMAARSHHINNVIKPASISANLDFIFLWPNSSIDIVALYV